ncbi:hypothetical protein QFZ66_000052 [Streptomyces sp. B4I13]|uniref:hypothetical protein n=1 Tax=Streptomyces sp. B4I13 TaxID=3042271 RepID=UPI00277EBDF0|nr:hypothetical protein [Streptomyces sp. B4I13]MDQ0956174.1 hypothetical protein [Streptomyces sp. B4I13]
MRITVRGAGAIGGNLAAKLSTAGHDAQRADARGPEAVRADVLETGGPSGGPRRRRPGTGRHRPGPPDLMPGEPIMVWCV